jgi:hypothetical protein
MTLKFVVVPVLLFLVPLSIATAKSALPRIEVAVSLVPISVGSVLESLGTLHIFLAFVDCCLRGFVCRGLPVSRVITSLLRSLGVL